MFQLQIFLFRATKDLQVLLYRYGLLDSNYILSKLNNQHSLRCRDMVTEVTQNVPLHLIASLSIRYAVNLGQTQAPLLQTMAIRCFHLTSVTNTARSTVNINSLFII